VSAVDGVQLGAIIDDDVGGLLEERRVRREVGAALVVDEQVKVPVAQVVVGRLIDRNDTPSGSASPSTM